MHPRSSLPWRFHPGRACASAPGPDDAGAILILEKPEGPGERVAGAIIGLAVPSVPGGWYLGCITCHAAIGEPDAGMCGPCREAQARQDMRPGACDEPGER